MNTKGQVRLQKEWLDLQRRLHRRILIDQRWSRCRGPEEAHSSQTHTHTHTHAHAEREREKNAVVLCLQGCVLIIDLSKLKY
jgi:hypothetical protein